jgi:hypothetical protein
MANSGSRDTTQENLLRVIPKSLAPDEKGRNTAGNFTRLRQIARQMDQLPLNVSPGHAAYVAGPLIDEALALGAWQADEYASLRNRVAHAHIDIALGGDERVRVFLAAASHFDKGLLRRPTCDDPWLVEQRGCHAIAASLEAEIKRLAEGERKRRGRKKADYATQKREAQIAADWEQAKNAGTYKCDFARDKGMKTADLDKLLDRVAKRKKSSE